MTLRQRLVYAAKLVTASLLYYTGLLHVYQRRALRGRAVVLTYHRVLTTEQRARSASHPAIVVDRGSFAGQMRLLRRSFHVLSIDEFTRHLEERIPFPDCSCVITFDDGWEDNWSNALPILEAHDLPALIFLPVNYVGSRRLFWQEALTHLLTEAVRQVRRDPARRAAFEPILRPRQLVDVLDCGREDPRAEVIVAVGRQKGLERASLNALMRELEEATGTRGESFAGVDGFMGWDEARTMTARRVAFGGHGAEHLLLTHVSEEEADVEIRTSKAVLAERLAAPVPTFSYPNGYMNPRLAAMVEAAGYRLAFTTGNGRVTCDVDRFAVGRLNVHESATGTVPMFMARVIGLW